MSDTSTQRTNRSYFVRGVTLVEILITVCIALLLMALLLPSVGKFIRAGDSAKCVQNLRQLQFAFQSFVFDNDGTLPDKQPKRFFPYLGLPEDGVYRDTAYTCPSLQRSRLSRSVDVNHRNYGINLYATTEKPIKGNDKYLRIEYPSQMILFTEGIPTDNPGAAPDGAKGRIYFSNFRLEHKEEMFFPHDKRQNAVFVDGSVRRVDKEEIYQEGKWNVPFWRGY